MSGFRSNSLSFLAALLMACPSLCCAQFSLDHSEQTAHDSCCQAKHDFPAGRPSEPTTPDECCCQADLTLPSNSVRVADGDVASLVEFFVEPEQLLATAAEPSSRQNFNTGPPLRVLQCVWLN